MILPPEFTRGVEVATALYETRTANQDAIDKVLKKLAPMIDGYVFRSVKDHGVDAVMGGANVDRYGRGCS